MSNFRVVSGDADSNEQRRAKIEALLRELFYCEQRDLPDRIKAIKRELSRLGHEGEKPAARAERRPASGRASKRG